MIASRPPLSRGEFIALMAMLFATVAFSIDAMLPALPQIGAELSPDNLNRAQLILTSFVIGMGIGTFFIGAISDAFGRKPVVIAGAALYILGAFMAWVAPSLELMLAARFIQGLGTAAPRVVGMAMVRDIYSGREMARIMSFVMLVFMTVPALAPLIGTGIIAIAGWRGIFAAFILFSLIATTWLGLRQPETLPGAARRPIKLSLMIAAVWEMFAHPTVRLSILAQSMSYVLLFLTISLIQPVFDVVFDRAHGFPFWFAGMALVSASSSLINATLVMRFGMRRLATIAYGTQVVLSLVMSLLWIAGLPLDVLFAAFLIWQTMVFFQTGMTVGNLNAIAMEPMGHIAGMAASVIGSVATIVGAMIAIPIGLAFDATPLPLTLGAGAVSTVAFLLMRAMHRIELREPSAIETNIV